jgi:hypothetical protein
MAKTENVIPSNASIKEKLQEDVTDKQDFMMSSIK